MILVCECTYCIIPDKICIAWEEPNFQFTLWYMARMSVPFRIADNIQMVQLTYKLNSHRDMPKEEDMEEVFMGERSHTGLHVS